MRSLSLLEGAVSFAVAGSVLAVGVPAFLRDLHASRLVEPMAGLARISSAAAASAQKEPVVTAYPPSVSLTPAVIPAGTAVQDAPGTWQHPTWVSLGFGFDTAHRYSFEFDSERRAKRSRYRATARGDLDADGQLSEFSVQGEVSEGRAPVTYPLEIHREVE